MGWDVDRFPGEVDSELICCICTGVLEDPAESPCRHVFCSACVKPWINKKSTCPQSRANISEEDLKPVVPILKNIVDKRKICCEYKENGCEDIVTIEALQRHLEKCLFEPSRAQSKKASGKNISQASSTKVRNLSPVQGKEGILVKTQLKSKALFIFNSCLWKEIYIFSINTNKKSTLSEAYLGHCPA